MSVSIPASNVPPTDAHGWRREWYNYFLFLGNRAAPATEQPEYKLLGPNSVVVSGLLQNGLASVSLKGDQLAPDNRTYYGTDDDGAKGWHLIADALDVTADLTKSQDGTTNVVTFGLADLADSGAGASLVKITRDAKGRVEGTQAANLADLADVAETAPSDGQVLTYDTTNGWQPETPSGGASATINAQTGVSYTAQLSDAGNVVTMDNAAANDFIVPPDSSVAFEDGATLEVWQKGAGQTTIVADTGVTILYDDSLTLALNGQDAGASLRKVAANTWRLIGIMEPASSTTYVQSVVAGTNVTVDNTDPANPVVSASGAGGGYDEGTSFPVTPASGDKFYRTDLNLLCFYDGTRWLTVTLYETSVAGGDAIPISTSNFQSARFPVRSDFGIYLERWVAATYVATTNNGSNYWTNALQWNTQGNVSTTLASFNTSADTVANNMRHEATVNTVIDSTAVTLGVRVTKTGSPGAIYGLNTLVYRLIVT